MDDIDLSRLEHPSVKDYLINTADRRVLAGARFILEALNIPYPEYLDRKPAGRPLARRIMADFRSDHPETLHEATQRRSREYASRLSARVTSSAILR
ncbi:MAG TPA: hypothetical protein VF463_07785 [Sphingobium sp.]